VTGAVRVSEDAPSEETLRLLNRTIAGVSEDYAALRNNTAAAKLIELTNHLTKSYPGGAPRSVAEPLVLMVAPLAPHVAEELWELLGHSTSEGPGSLAHGPFPVTEQRWLTADTVDYPVQVGGKVRAVITVAADADRDVVLAAALVEEKIAVLVDGREPRKVIFVPGRLVNLVL